MIIKSLRITRGKTKTVTELMLTNIDESPDLNVRLEEYHGNYANNGKASIFSDRFAWTWSWSDLKGLTIDNYFCECEIHYLSQNLRPPINSTIGGIEYEWWFPIPKQPNPQYHYLSQAVSVVQSALDGIFEYTCSTENNILILYNEHSNTYEDTDHSSNNSELDIFL